MQRCMAVPCKERKSAVVLSVWHCMLSEFLVRAEKEHLESEQFKEVMTCLYQHIGGIRQSIEDDHTAEKMNETMSFLAMQVKWISTDVNLVARTEKWATEVGFLMQELADMEALLLNQHKDDLKQHKMQDDDFNHFMEQQQPRHVACLITLWYWVAAWSSVSGVEKVQFITSVENSWRTVSSLLFSTKDNLQDNDRTYLKDMLSKLLEMLSNSPDRWLNVVRHFTENMVETACTLGVISTNIKMNNNKDTDTTVTPLVLKSKSDRSRVAPHTWPTKAVQLVREEADRRGPCKPVFKKLLLKEAPVTHAVDSLKNVIVDVWHGIENVGHDVNTVIGAISPALSGAAHVIPHVKDLAHTIGKGLAHLFHSIF